MYFVDNGNNYDASLNIALETYLVENRLVDEPILLFYINDPSVNPECRRTIGLCKRQSSLLRFKYKKTIAQERVYVA